MSTHSEVEKCKEVIYRALALKKAVSNPIFCRFSSKKAKSAQQPLSCQVLIVVFYRATNSNIMLSFKDRSS